MLQIAKVMTLTAQEITSKLTEQYKDVQVGIEFITPEQAQIYMGRNFKNNRKVVLSNILELEKEMKTEILFFFGHHPNHKNIILHL